MTGSEAVTDLAAASARLAALVPALEAGAPWPLAPRFDHAPEAEWGPPEVLAHLAEMLPFWLGEAERVLDGGDTPVPFGRIATDEVRIAVLARDRSLPIRELVARVVSGMDRWSSRWRTLDDDARARIGMHPTLGAMTVADIARRFVTVHLDEHLEQLETALGRVTDERGGPR
jgi:hypothetical protein